MERNFSTLVIGSLLISFAGGASGHGAEALKHGKPHSKPVQKGAAGPLKFPLINLGCKETEEWKIAPLIPSSLSEEMRETLAKPPVGASAAFETLKAAFAFRSAAHTPELQALADYILARSFYEMKLVHIAHSSFVRLVKRVKAPSVGMEVVTAGLQCLHQIRRSYPTLKINSDMTGVLIDLEKERLSGAQKIYIWRTLSSIAGRKLSDHAGYHSVAPELEGLRGSGPYEVLIRAMDAAKQGKDASAIESTQLFLKFSKLPPDLAVQANAMRLNLGRMYYNQNKYREAIAQFKMVTKNSNLYPASIMDSAWAYLLLGDYKEAASQSVNLVYRGLRSVYSPHAPVLLAIVQFENCRYKEAFDSIKLFKKYYGTSYKVLYNWYKSQVGNQTNYYQLMLDYFDEEQKGDQKDKKNDAKGAKRTNIPKNLVSEWIKSPEFIGLQSEINLLIEESKLISELRPDLTQASGKFSGMQPSAIQYLSQTFDLLEKSRPAIETSLINAVNNEILWRNYHMMVQLVDAFDNSQLLEAEVLKELGTRVLDKNRDTKGVPNAPDKKSGFNFSGLDWGNVSEDPYTEEEVWNDELGSIQAEVVNLCGKK